MVKELSKGGKLVWIAPSGGRDRPDADTGAWLPHKYDAGKLLTKFPYNARFMSRVLWCCGISLCASHALKCCVGLSNGLRAWSTR